MITPDLLKTLKDLRAKVPQGQVVVTQLDARGTNLQMTTAGQGAVAIGFFRNRANADYAAAAWEWLPRLIEEMESQIPYKTFEPFTGMEGITRMVNATPQLAEELERRGAVVRPRRQPRVRKRAPVE